MPELSNKWLTCTANQPIKKLAFKARKFLPGSLDESKDIMPRGSWSESVRLHAQKHGHDTSQERTSSATSMPCTLFGMVPLSDQFFITVPSCLGTSRHPNKIQVPVLCQNVNEAHGADILAR